MHVHFPDLMNMRHEKYMYRVYSRVYTFRLFLIKITVKQFTYSTQETSKHAYFLNKAAVHS